ncbi:hypothetical protein XIS1_1440043 [Xenorhabdus innexi]|uniref:Uncharacterized protein n=1 Tax=Xenorhabdus innexi TaxID=290109 RepID=A0A1N6MU82_9GAMM|nr:hypothetical protein XIS1_1440043 [Xenorhabdus innexi]
MVALKAIYPSRKYVNLLIVLLKIDMCDVRIMSCVRERW